MCNVKIQFYDCSKCKIKSSSIVRDVRLIYGIESDGFMTVVCENCGNIDIIRFGNANSVSVGNIYDKEYNNG